MVHIGANYEIDEPTFDEAAVRRYFASVLKRPKEIPKKRNVKENHSSNKRVKTNNEKLTTKTSDEKKSTQSEVQISQVIQIDKKQENLRKRIF